MKYLQISIVKKYQILRYNSVICIVLRHDPINLLRFNQFYYINQRERNGETKRDRDKERERQRDRNRDRETERQKTKETRRKYDHIENRHRHPHHHHQYCHDVTMSLNLFT